MYVSPYRSPSLSPYLGPYLAPHQTPPPPHFHRPSQLEERPMSEEGGRMAVSGENGWVFFDYHLATFGGRPPEGPLRLQMAFPPHGCDPAAYTVRIKGAAVAILRCPPRVPLVAAPFFGGRPRPSHAHAHATHFVAHIF